MSFCVYGPCSSLCLIRFSSHSHHPPSHSFLIRACQPTFPPISLLQQSLSGGAFPDQPSNHAHPNAQADRSISCALSYRPMYRRRCRPSHWFDYLPVDLPPPWMVNSWGKELGLFLTWYQWPSTAPGTINTFLKEWIQHLINILLCAQNSDRYWGHSRRWLDNTSSLWNLESREGVHTQRHDSTSNDKC